MSDKGKRLRMILLGAAGAAGAFIGVTALARRLRGRWAEMPYEARMVDSMQSQAWHAGGMSGGEAGGITGEGQTGRPVSTPQETWETPVAAETMKAEENARGGDVRPLPGETGRYQPVDQPDYTTAPAGPIPQTGGESMTYDALTQDVTAQETSSPVSLGEMVGPLIVHLLGFKHMIDMVKRRQAEGADTGETRTLNLSGSATNIEETAGYGEGNLQEGTLQMRIYKLLHKVQDALENQGYTDDDLFRIFGEVRPEACRVLRDVEKAGENNVTGFDEAKQAYECR